MQAKREFDFGFAVMAWLVALVVVWIAAQAISALTVGHDISETGCVWVIGISLIIAILLGRWSGNESARERVSQRPNETARLQAEEVAKREREAIAAVRRKAELLGRHKLDWSEEKLLTQEEAKEEAKQWAKCPKCMMKIDCNAKICPHCRTSFEDVHRCGRCRMIVDQYAQICPYCQADFRSWWERD